jgi:hypothetical protein
MSKDTRSLIIAIVIAGLALAVLCLNPMGWPL